MSDISRISDRLDALHERVIGILQDEGWPAPWCNNIIVFNRKATIWRRGDSGSSLTLETEAANNPIRHTVMVQIILDDRFVLVDLARLPLWPGEHPPETLVAVLRHFRSVVE